MVTSAISKFKNSHAQGNVVRPFMNLDQYRFQILLFLIAVPTLSRQNKVTKMCPKFIRLDRLSTKYR